MLELSRIDEPQDPHAFRFEPQGYTLRHSGGGLERFDIPWTRELLADLEALRQPGRDPAVVQRVGELLQRALRPIGWMGLGESIRAASEVGQPVVVTLRSNAAELYALPWELLTVGASGQHLGELPGVLLRHEWPATTTTAEDPSPRPEGGPVLLAWSAAGGAVPAAEHQRALGAAWTEGCVHYDPAANVLSHASMASLADALASAEKAGKPFAILHLLAHGGRAGSTYGLVLDGEDGSATVVDAGRLRQLLAPFAKTLRLVVLAACDGGNAGDPGNHLGSVAQALHRSGFQAVLASRHPLSITGSIILAEALYRSLLVDLHPLERAFTDARARLAHLAGHLDWASLQLYTRETDGDDTRPVVFCPYRGLLVFEARHRRFFHGRDAERTQTLGDMQALVDANKPRFLVVVGASGTGKSSMVMAGVVPDVERLKASRPGRWDVLRMLPGAEPVAGLRDLLVARANKQIPLLLVVDQFEEVFTHTSDPTTRQAFVRELWSLSKNDTGIHVIVTLRVDFLGHCGDLVVDNSGLRLDRVAYDEAHRVFVARMGPEQVRAAIETPASRIGLHFEPGLLERILADVGAEPGALPLLQYALTRLWQRRRGHTLTAEVYEAIGGLVGALEKDADDLVKGLDGEQRRHARHLLTQLVDTSEDEAVDTRRRVGVTLLEPVDMGRRSAFDAVLARLVNARLVVRSEEAGAPTLEIAHEALIRRWGVLRGWIAEDRVSLVEIGKLHEWTRDWAEHKTLLTGTKLDRASEFVRQHSDEVDESVHRLVRASEDERHRLAAESEAQRRRRRTTVAAVISVLVIAVLGMTGVSLYALEQQARAEELLETSKGITKELLIEVLPKYADIPGTVDVQRELHERLKTMLKTLRADTENDPDVLHLEIQQKLRRGALADSHEQLEQARAEYQQASDLAERLIREYPDDFEARYELASSLIKLGAVDVPAGKTSAAHDDYTRAIEILDALNLANPSEMKFKTDLSFALLMLGELEMMAGDLEAALSHCTRSLQVAEYMVKSHPTGTDPLRNLGFALAKLGQVEIYAGKFMEARGHLDRSLQVREELVMASPSSVQAQLDLTSALDTLANVELEVGNLAAARTLLLRSLQVREQMAKIDPTNARYQRNIAVSLNALGDTEMLAMNTTQARPYHERMVRITENLVSMDPTNVRAQRDLHVAISRLGRLELNASDLKAARAALSRAAQVAEVLAALDPTSALGQRDVSAAHIMLGHIDMSAGDLASARNHIGRAIEVLDAVAIVDPTNAEIQYELVEAIAVAGAIDVKEGKFMDARTTLGRALRIFERLSKAGPTAILLERSESNILDLLGGVELTTGNVQTARAHMELALKIRIDLAKAEPTNNLNNQDLLNSHLNLGGLDLEDNDFDAARIHLVRALQIAKDLALDPHDSIAQRNLSIAMDRNGDLEAKLGNLALARELYQTALTLAEVQAKVDPSDSDPSFELVEIHLDLIELAKREKRTGLAIRHAKAAKTLLEAMNARGQVRGFSSREKALERVKHELDTTQERQ